MVLKLGFDWRDLERIVALERGFEEDTGHHLSHWQRSKHFALKPIIQILSWLTENNFQEERATLDQTCIEGKACWLSARQNGQDYNI